MIALALLLALQAVPATVTADAAPGEDPVAPYAHANANAGAAPFAGDAMWRAFHRRDGVTRIVEALVARSQRDPRISDIFKGQDMVRLRRTLIEQFCYILNGGCDYSGRTMRASHKDLGIQGADMTALVENLQAAMRAEGVNYRAQNRFLARLAPMKRDVVQR